MGLMESNSSSTTIESWTLAAVSIIESGMPLRSTTRWRFVPHSPLSVGFAPVFWPLYAGMEAESKEARSQSICSAPPRRSSRTERRRSHTPASCHFWRRRQQVTPLAQPIYWGSISQGMPLFSTKMMPLRAARSSRRGLPPLGLGGSSGNSGSTISQSSSLTNSLAILLTYPDAAVLKGSLSA
jgi:hypothetical protein